MEQNIGIIH